MPTTSARKALLFGGALTAAGIAHADPALNFIDGPAYESLGSVIDYLTGAYAYGNYNLEGFTFDTPNAFANAGFTADSAATTVRTGGGIGSQAGTQIDVDFIPAPGTTAALLEWTFNPTANIFDTFDVFLAEVDANGNPVTVLFDNDAAGFPRPPSGAVEFTLDPAKAYNLVLRPTLIGENGEIVMSFTAVDPSQIPCPTDLDGDNTTDLTDLLIVLSAFGASADGDTNNDGTTDLTDLLAVLADFGTPCE